MSARNIKSQVIVICLSVVLSSRNDALWKKWLIRLTKAIVDGLSLSAPTLLYTAKCFLCTRASHRVTKNVQNKVDSVPRFNKADIFYCITKKNNLKWPWPLFFSFFKPWIYSSEEYGSHLVQIDTTIIQTKAPIRFIHQCFCTIITNINQLQGQVTSSFIMKMVLTSQATKASPRDPGVPWNTTWASRVEAESLSQWDMSDS